MKLEPRFIRAYEILMDRFGTRPFTFEEASEVLEGNVQDILSKLRKAGLISVKSHPEDRRRKIYVIEKISPERNGSEKTPTRDDLIRILKQGADIIRTRVDYKVLLLFLFYKAVSDKYEKEVQKALSRGDALSKARLRANRSVLTMYDSKKKVLYTWNETHHDFQRFINAFRELERLEPERLRGLGSLVDRTGLANLVNIQDNRHIITQLINLFGKFDFADVPYDLLGDAYEWILSYFAPTKAKEGEVYTPLPVSRLMAHLLDPSGSVRILDPASGSGSMLIEMYKYVVSKNPDDPPMLTGQEANEISAVLSRLNFILHGIKNAEVFHGDSLRNPRFERAHFSTANPPWNQDGYDESTLKDNPKHELIFRYGYPTRQSADWAWIQLLDYYAENKATVVIDTGALFRGGRERNIRKGFVDDDLIEAVILLPEKLFYNTQAPAVIIVINHNKSPERQGKILFINASREFVPHPDVRKLNTLSDENIGRIVEAYRNFRDVEGFARVVSLEEIRERDYNLNVPLYVAPIEEGEQIDLKAELEEMEKLNKEYSERYSRVKEYLEEIGRLTGGERG